ncbi:MAG: hypothetical protein BroJett040_20700 [Oligoflexia bacterium]|nr:MAG: hypothetical protein BroJett040_20700 [Oligoflexia bacterium]
MATAIAGIHEKAQAGFYNMGAFWKGTSSAQAATIGSSLRFRSSATASLNKAFVTATNRRKFTWSAWVKKASLGLTQGLFDAYYDGSNFATFQFTTTDTLQAYVIDGGIDYSRETVQVFRDISSWMHIVFVYDSDNATAADRLIFYVNGIRVTSTTDSYGTIPQNYSSIFNTTYTHYIARRLDNNKCFDGYLSQVCLVDGQAFAPSIFGGTHSTTGEWKPLTSSQIRTNVTAGGGWGNNGVMLLFNDATSTTTLGYDRKTSDSGTGNNWTATNISVTAGPTYDVMVDSPSNGTSGTRPAGNYCVLSPLKYAGVVPIKGNLECGYTGAAINETVGTMALPTSGNVVYWEIPFAASGGNSSCFGVIRGDIALTNSGTFTSHCGTGRWTFEINNIGNYRFYNESTSATNMTGGSTPTAGTSVLCLAYNPVSRGLWCGYSVSGTGAITWYSSGDPTTDSNPLVTLPSGYDLFPFRGANDVSGNYINFGQGGFLLSCPTTFRALCTANLPEPTILKPSQHFDVLTYTGTGGVKHVGQSGSIPYSGIPSTSFPFAVNNSLRLRASATAYLSRAGFSADRTKQTLSLWVKRGRIGVQQPIRTAYLAASAYDRIEFTSTDTIRFHHVSSSITYIDVATSIVFRDPSAWYHLVFQMDGAQSSGSRWKIWVNGVQVTFSGTDNTNSVLFGDGPSSNRFFYDQQSGAYYDGYVAELHFIEGSIVSAASFGQIESTTGTWVPKQYTGGNYGTNGFYLPFSDTSQLTSGSNVGIGKDFSGNTNYWNTNNISLTAGVTYDAMIDSPTNAASGTQPVGNYCALNPLDMAASVTLSNANLRQAHPQSGFGACSTALVKSGKWYWEVTFVSYGSGNALILGIVRGDSLPNTNMFAAGGGVGYYSNGNKYIDGTLSAYGATYAPNDVIGFALDVDAGTLECFKQTGGSGAFASQGVITLPSTTSGWKTLGINGSSTYGAMTTEWNFGQRPFNNSSVPASYKTICTANLPAPSSSLWTPDLVWIKDRTTANNHAIADTVRGAFSMQASNAYAVDSVTTQAVQRFYPGGFTVGNDVTTGTNNDNYVAWMWRAGGPAVTNSSGSISSLVSGNATGGFSIVSYVGTGANGTVGHGLGTAPKMVIVKARDVANQSWNVYHASLTSAAYRLLLDGTGGESSTPTSWNSTAPTSSVFSVGTATSTNGNGTNFIAYCFAEIPGFSKIGSYTGNSSADGPFVWCGFRPKFIMIKETTLSTGHWFVFDSIRNTYNVMTATIRLSSSLGEEVGTNAVDILSSGFKLRHDGTVYSINRSQSYIFIAFAEMPFKYANAR